MKHGTESRFFTQPSGPKHRLYEALRALFVEGLPAKEVGERFDYCPQTLYVQASLFRAGKLSPFFVENRPGPKTRPMRDPVQENVIELRKKNYSIYDISHVLKEKKHNLSPRSVWEILHEAGFARLPRRLDEEKPALGPGPQPAPKADRRKLNLGPGQVFETAVAGLFLFLPDLVKMGIETCVEEARYPGTKTIPPLQYILSLVALKLLGRERYSHVMDCCHDVGLGLFAGLNAIPKTTALTTYSYRIVRAKNLGFLGALVQVGREKGAYNGESINLDFHAIPHFGEESVLEKHYVPRRSHAEKSVLVCLGHDLESRAFCYSNADIFHEDSADEVLRFAEFWKKATGEYPKELVFDSRFTTIKTLNRLNQMGIRFITLRRKSPKVIAELLSLPTASWRRCELDVPHRKYKNPRFYDSRIKLKGYEGPLRQIAAIDLGRDLPTLVITNHDRKTKVPKILVRYAQRMLVENAIADGVHFFHIDALCSSLHLEVDFSVALTVLSDTLYRLLAKRIRGFEDATAKQIYRKFIACPGQIAIEKDKIVVRLNRHAHNPLLMAAGFSEAEVRVPWLADYEVRYEFA